MAYIILTATARCRYCGYDARGLEAAASTGHIRCPECGRSDLPENAGIRSGRGTAGLIAAILLAAILPVGLGVIALVIAVWSAHEMRSDTPVRVIAAVWALVSLALMYVICSIAMRTRCRGAGHERVQRGRDAMRAFGLFIIVLAIDVAVAASLIVIYLSTASIR